MQLLPRPLRARLIGVPVPHDALTLALADLLARGVILWLLVVGLMAFSAWAGHAVTNPGGWLEADKALYRALNGISLWPLTAFFVATLNEPAPVYFGLILLILGYCWWRSRAMLPAAALAIAVALALGLAATKEIHHAGGSSRERPFVYVAEATTPITSCDGGSLVALRNADGPTASCDESEGELIGFDWRSIWLEFRTFPSGHLRETAALCLLLAVFWPASWPFALAFTLVAGFSRIQLGAHYPTDVLAGMIIGLWVGGTTLFGLDLLRRLLTYLRRVPPVGAVWDWIFGTRVAGRPDLDPLVARLIRVGAYVAVANVALYGLGYASTSPATSQIHSVLQSADIWAYSQLTAGFDPARAAAVYIAFGPVGWLYAALAGLTVAFAWLRGRVFVGPAVVALAVAVALAFELRWLGEQLFYRAPPFIELEQAPVPPQWRDLWRVATSFPSLHALLAAALAGVLAGTCRLLSIPAQLLGVAGALTAIYFGAAWVTDALVGYLLGNVAAMLAWHIVAQFIAPTDAGVASERGVAAETAPRRGSPPAGERVPARGDR